MNIENLKKEPKLTIPVAVSLVGFVFNFIGICIAQAERGYSPFNDYGLQWYFLFFYLAWIALMLLSISTLSLFQNKQLLLVMTSIMLVFLPMDIERSLYNTYKGTSAAGNGIKVLGLIIFIFAVFPVMVVMGVEQDSPLLQFEIKIPSLPLKKKEEKQVLQTFVPPEPFAASLERAPNSNTTLEPIQTSVPMSASPDSMEVKAIALYPYDANESDPNEISFGKDEVLVVTDSKGKWWHVVKSNPDGSKTTGIAPSNYLQMLP